MPAKELAIQTFCFRNAKSNDCVADLVNECGLQAVELSGLHADFGREDVFDEAIGCYRDRGIKIVSIGVEHAVRDEERLRSRFEFVRRAGASVLSVAFPEDAAEANYRLIERLCEEYDIQVGLHNHGSYHWQGSSQAIRRLFSRINSRVGLCLDTAWALDAGQDPLAMVEEFADRLYLVHVKDFVFDRAGNPEDVVVGEGNLDLPALVQRLDDVGFEGPVILEYEGQPENPLPELIKCVHAIRDAVARLTTNKSGNHG
jgi:sugar phosphate isomerase/epimerase